MRDADSKQFILQVVDGWYISLFYDSENTIIKIVDKDDETEASIALDDLELTAFIKMLEIAINCKRKEYSD